MINNQKILSTLESLDDNSRLIYYNKIKKYKNECGCKLGGIFTGASIFVCMTYSVFSFHSMSALAMVKIFIFSILITFCMGIIGKSIGIIAAKIKLMLVYKTILLTNKKVKSYGKM